MSQNKNKSSKEEKKTTDATKTSENASEQSKSEQFNGNRGNKNYKDKKRGKRCYPNDPLFYAQDEAALRAMASFNWADKLGNGSISGGVSNVKIPGILRLSMTPSFGHFSSQMDISKNDNQLTLAADAFFNNMSQGYTGSVPYEAPDLLMYVLAAEGIRLKIKQGIRAYGAMKFASPFNSYMPYKLVEALGFEYDDLNDNLADFRSRLNTIITQVQKWIVVPKGFTIADRWEYLCDNIMIDFKDHEKMQFYVYTFDQDITVDTTTLNTGTALKLTPAAKKHTVDTYFAELNTLIQDIKSQDVNNIFGSLRRVYSEDQFKTISLLDENYVTPVLHEDIILEQVHNAMVSNPLFVVKAGLFVTGIPESITNDSDMITSIVMYQENGNVYSRPVSLVDASTDIKDKDQALIDMLVSGYPGPANFIDATANVIAPENEFLAYAIITANPVTRNVYAIVPRSEIVASATIYTLDEEISFDQHWNINLGSASLMGPKVKSLAAMSSFNYGLIAYYGSPSEYAVFGELNNYGFIPFSSIAKTNRLSFAKLLSLPTYSKSVTK